MSYLLFFFFLYEVKEPTILRGPHCQREELSFALGLAKCWYVLLIIAVAVTEPNHYWALTQFVRCLVMCGHLYNLAHTDFITSL